MPSLNSYGLRTRLPLVSNNGNASLGTGQKGSKKKNERKEPGTAITRMSSVLSGAHESRIMQTHHLSYLDSINGPDIKILLVIILNPFPYNPLNDEFKSCLFTLTAVASTSVIAESRRICTKLWTTSLSLVVTSFNLYVISDFIL